jgi:hypothetical protein
MKDMKVLEFVFFNEEDIANYRSPQFSRTTRRLKDYCKEEKLTLTKRY